MNFKTKATLFQTTSPAKELWNVKLLLAVARCRLCWPTAYDWLARSLAHCAWLKLWRVLKEAWPDVMSLETINHSIFDDDDLSPINLPRRCPRVTCNANALA